MDEKRKEEEILELTDEEIDEILAEEQIADDRNHACFKKFSYYCFTATKFDP